MGKKLLSYKRVVRERDTVEIDGVEYEVRNFEDLGPFETAKAMLVYTQMAEIENSNKISTESLKEAEAAFEEFLLLMIVGFGKEQLNGLTGAEKWEIFETFSLAVQERSKEQTSQKPAPPKQDANQQRQAQMRALPRNQHQNQSGNGGQYRGQKKK